MRLCEGHSRSPNSQGGNNKVFLVSETICFQHIDTGVLLENTQLVKFMRNCIRDPSGVFSIASLAKMSTTSFPAFSRLFEFGCLYIDNKMNITHEIEDMYEFYVHKVHIFSPPCNNLYIFVNDSSESSGYLSMWEFVTRTWKSQWYFKIKKFLKSPRRKLVKLPVVWSLQISGP